MSYEKELQVALEVAKEAGEILRNEFHRSGGPRGASGHADADEEAEWVIRKKLLENFPNYRYLGEETGSVGGPASRIWLVDPNDGTSAYLRGVRGSAVSIALLENRIPVLGVVYSFAFPDDGGDLISYAEGLSLQRNGKSLEPRWNLSDPNRVVVLVSLRRENIVDRILECIRPYRYLAIPSIAYRLALVAAGDGTVAVSWHKPGDWDYAAGHALLRGAGGIFIDEEGREIAYADDGSSQVKRCFGGAGPVVRELSKRNWATAIPGFHSSSDTSSEPFSRARLKPGESVTDSALLSRAQGCFLGLCCLDAVARFKNHNAEPGRITRNCEMAIVLARTIVSNRPYEPQTMPLSDQENADPYLAAMIRMVPLGIYGSRHLPNNDWFWKIAAQESARIRPEHPLVQQTCALLALGIGLAVRYGGTATEVYEKVLDIAKAKSDVDSTVINSLETTAHRLAHSDEYKDPELFVFHNAFYELLHSESMEKTIREARSPITGAFVGALQGRESIPREWRQLVLSCRPQSRPQYTWTIDLLTLTELLLL